MAIFLEKSITFLKSNLGNFMFDIHANNILMRGDEYIMADPFMSNIDINSIYRLPLSMDSFGFLNNTSVNYGSTEYVSGRKNTDVVVAKDIATNNIKVWTEPEAIQKFKLNSSDFPKKLLDNKQIIEIIANQYLNKGNALPHIITDAILTTAKACATYASRLAHYDIVDSYFYENITKVDFKENYGRLRSIIIIADAALPNNERTEFYRKLIHWICETKTDVHPSAEDMFSIISRIIKLTKTDENIRDILMKCLKDNIDLDNNDWAYVAEEVVAFVDDDEIVALFK